MAMETASPTAVPSNQNDIHELKRTFQALEIDLQGQHNRVSVIQRNPGSGTIFQTQPFSISSQAQHLISLTYFPLSPQAVCDDISLSGVMLYLTVEFINVIMPQRKLSN